MFFFYRIKDKIYLNVNYNDIIYFLNKPNDTLSCGNLRNLYEHNSGRFKRSTRVWIFYKMSLFLLFLCENRMDL